LTEFIDNYVVVLDTDTAIKHYGNDDFSLFYHDFDMQIEFWTYN